MNKSGFWTSPIWRLGERTRIHLENRNSKYRGPPPCRNRAASHRFQRLCVLRSWPYIHPRSVDELLLAITVFDHRCEGLFQIQLSYLKRVFSQRIRVTADQSLTTFTAYLAQ